MIQSIIGAWRIFVWAGLASLLISACAAGPPADVASSSSKPLQRPPVPAADLDGRRLQVVATTSIVGDVVGQIGGQDIVLTTLINAGQEPHSYLATPADLRTAAAADLIFSNGWDLEGSLAHELGDVAPGAPQVPMSAGIQPRPLAAGQGEAGVDPHVWLDPRLLRQWSANAAWALTAADPAHAAAYEGRRVGFERQLDALISHADEAMGAISPEERQLVSQHANFGYLADRYGINIVGLLSAPTSGPAEPSAGRLAELAQAMDTAGICTIFVEAGESDDLVSTLAKELDGCPDLQVVALRTESLGPPGTPADSTLGLARAAVDAVSRALGDGGKE
ncbi:MAG: metal ABC transporter substrate-binding protein [Candidatus Promineifilaceae bacterium]